MLNKTIKEKTTISGIGIHSGQVVNMLLSPYDEGIRFIKKNGAVIDAIYSNVTSTAMNTSLSSGDNHVGTVEHFMAALYALEISNLLVEIDGDEIPVLDGSSIEFCKLLERNILDQSTTRQKVEILEKISVEDGDAEAHLEPSNNFVVDMEIDFSHPCIGKQKFVYDSIKDDFFKEIAPARTFGFLKDFEYLQKNGLAKGGSLDNAVVLDEVKVINKEGLRFKDEFVRHKILDSVGDLFLANFNIIGKFVGKKSGHKLNNMLLRKLFSNNNYYRVVE